MMPSRDWFDLQLRCAERAAAIAGLSIAAAVLRFTVIYQRLGLGYTFDAEAPRWREYLRGLAGADDRAAYTAACCAPFNQPPATSPFGCFSYTHVPEEGRVRLHFVPVDQSGAGALGHGRQAARREELRVLFDEVALRHPATRTVRGNSWLHGITAYRRLFPPEYAASALAAPMVEEFAYMAFWGQFLDHRGELKSALAAEFAAGLVTARTIDELALAVPCPVYEVECPIAHFYSFYGVAAPSSVAQ